MAQDGKFENKIDILSYVYHFKFNFSLVLKMWRMGFLLATNVANEIMLLDIASMNVSQTWTNLVKFAYGGKVSQFPLPQQQLLQKMKLASKIQKSKK